MLRRRFGRIKKAEIKQHNRPAFLSREYFLAIDHRISFIAVGNELKFVVIPVPGNNSALLLRLQACASDN